MIPPRISPVLLESLPRLLRVTSSAILIAIAFNASVVLAETKVGADLNLELLESELEIETQECGSARRPVLCEFSCEIPIEDCGGWTPPPGSYEKEVWATPENAAIACEANADAVCKRCGGGKVAKFWFTIFKSVRWY